MSTISGPGSDVCSVSLNFFPPPPSILYSLLLEGQLLGKRNHGEKGFRNTVERVEACYNSMIRSQSFGNPMPVDC